MKHVTRAFVFVLLVFSLEVGCTCLKGAESQLLYGIKEITFETPYGKIRVNLPDDMAMGDLVSGTLISVPSGETEKKRAKNAKKLDRYSVEIGREKTAIYEGWGKWTIPDIKEMTVKLLDLKDNVVDSIRVPVYSQPLPTKNEGFQCPTIAQAEISLPVKGKFNGDFSDTDLKISDQELEKLVESPRMVIVESPKDVIGNTEIYYREGNVNGTCELRNISVHPSVGKFKLNAGETTFLSVIVRGLEGLDERVPLYIINRTATIVRVEGEKTIYIQPSDVRPEGSFVYRTVITGILPGRFNISIRVIDESETTSKK